jgi:hypothetical protein
MHRRSRVPCHRARRGRSDEHDGRARSSAGTVTRSIGRGEAKVLDHCSCSPH